MLIPNFLSREVAPRHHTHLLTDISGASAARRALFVSQNAPVDFSNTRHITMYFEVRDGLAVRASERWLINPWMDSVTPPVQPRGAVLSTAVVQVGDFFACNLVNARSRDFLLHTTGAGSGMVIYGEQGTLVDGHLRAELIGPATSNFTMAFPGP